MPRGVSAAAAASGAAAAAVAAAAAAAYVAYLRGRRARANGTHEESAAARDARLRAALAPLEKGLTVYWAGESPCARRVLIALREKGLEYKNCVISLLHGEQRHPAFLQINPQGKVPVLVCRGVEGVEDCVLFESAAIVTWLDEAFPQTKQLLPSARAARWEARLWQYWELCIAEEFWPLSRMQVDGVLWRWGYSPGEFEKVKGLMGGGDPFYTSKISNICRGTYLSPREMLCHQVRISRGFSMLERALADGRRFLVDGAFSIADISVLPRLLKAPINGVLATEEQRRAHKHVCAYFEGLRARPSMVPFRRPDDAAWGSGVRCYILSGAGFGPRWLDGLPWWVLVLVGNWRHGLRFRRVSWQDAAGPEHPIVLAGVLQAIPRVRLLPGEKPEWRLHADDALPLCTAVRIVLHTFVGAKALPPLRVASVSHARCENFSRQHLARMPWGELPCLVDGDGAVMYGPMNIADVACEEAAAGGGGSATMMPDCPNARAAVRRWAGWARTGWHYQLMPLYWRDVAGPALLKDFGPDRTALVQSLAAALGDADRVELDALPALHAYDRALARRGGSPAAGDEAYGANSEPELLVRCRFVNDELLRSSGGGAGGGFLDGSLAPTVADAFVAPLCAVALGMRYVPETALGELGALRAWLTRLKDFPAFESNLTELLGAWGASAAAASW